MKILSSFIHPQVVPTLYECLCSAEHKEEYLKKVCYQAVFWGTIDFHSRKTNTMEVIVPQNCSVSHILQNIFLYVQQNKDIHTGLELLEGE